MLSFNSREVHAHCTSLADHSAIVTDRVDKPPMSAIPDECAELGQSERAATERLARLLEIGQVKEVRITILALLTDGIVPLLHATH